MGIHKTIAIPFLFLFILISCGNNETGFVEERVIEHEGLKRSFLMYVPENIKENASLVVAIHGYTSTAKILMGYSGINQVADKEGFLVAYPQGTKDSRDNNFFNVGYEFHSDSKVNDVNFIREIVLNLTKDYKLNSKRVFATGMSNGGDMSYLLACTSSDLFTAVAPVAGVMMKDTLENCNPEKKIPIFEIHGTKDSISKFEGDMNNEDKWGAYYDLPSTIEFWVNKHALNEKETIQLENKNTEDGTTITFERYWSDESQREVWFYIVNDGNHTWPGMTGLFSRTTNQDINSAEEIWKFFSKF